MQKKQPISAVTPPETHTTKTHDKHKKHPSITVEESTSCTIFITQDCRILHKDEAQPKLFTRAIWPHEPLKINLISSQELPHETTPHEQKLIDIVNFSPDYHLKIGNSSFKCIAANNRDKRLSYYFENLKERDFCFVINSNNIDHCYIPTRIWQKRFIAMISQGLMSLLSMDAKVTSISSDPTMKVRRHEYQSIARKPTCFQYSMFQSYGETKDPHMRGGTYKLLPITKKHPEFGLFSKITILIPNPESREPKNYRKAHEFIHIGHGVGLGKIGKGAIFFHSISAIAEHYRNRYNSAIRFATESCLSLAESELKASLMEHYEIACSELSTNYESSDSEYYDTDEQYHEVLGDT